MASSVSGFEVSDSEGPVLTLLSKCLRVLKKKHNCILQLEATHLANDKTLNKVQVELLNSKPVVATLIDEYEKLRQPLSVAVHEKISKNESKCSSNFGEIEDLLGLLYFSLLFDVKPQREFTSTMLTRTHERGCCLTYDYVTDDATKLLPERDLDMLSAVGGMMVARSVYFGGWHKDVLEGCVRHVGLWLRNADQRISPDHDVICWIEGEVEENGAPIRFNGRNECSLLPYKDGTIIHVDGESKDSLVKSITKIIVIVAMLTLLIAILVKEAPKRFQQV